VPLPTNKQITAVLDLWVKRYRRVMLAGAQHDYCFVRPSGVPFGNSSQWTNTLVQLFQPRLSNGARVSVNALRKAFVSETWATATLEQRESNAMSMRHSMRTAERNYNATTSRDKVEVAVHRASRLWESSSESTAGGAAGGGGAGGGDEPRRSKRVRDVDSGHDALHLSPTSPSVAGGETDDSHELEADSDTDSQVGIVESLLRQRTHRGEQQYLVQWVGTPETTWEPEVNLPPACIREFFTNQLQRIGKKPRR
jgi:hypothetical protein